MINETRCTPKATKQVNTAPTRHSIFTQFFFVLSPSCLDYRLTGPIIDVFLTPSRLVLSHHHHQTKNNFDPSVGVIDTSKWSSSERSAAQANGLNGGAGVLPFPNQNGGLINMSGKSGNGLLPTDSAAAAALAWQQQQQQQQQQHHQQQQQQHQPLISSSATSLFTSARVLYIYRPYRLLLLAPMISTHTYSQAQALFYL